LASLFANKSIAQIIQEKDWKVSKPKTRRFPSKTNEEGSTPAKVLRRSSKMVELMERRKQRLSDESIKAGIPSISTL